MLNVNLARRCQRRKMLKLTIPVEPMGAVRMTGRGKPNAQRYLAYKDQIKWIVKQQLKD